MKFSALLLAVMLLATQALKAQSTCLGSDPVTTHANQTQIIFNPAYSAIPEQGEVHISGQNLANTFDSLECVTYTISFNKFWESSKSGLGGYFGYGVEPFAGRYLVANLSYSYKVWDYVAIGGSLGLGRREALFSQFQTTPLSELERRARYYPDLGFGIYLDYEGLQLGIGASHLNRPELIYSNTRTFRVDDAYFFNGSYEIKVDEALSFTPAFFGRFLNTSNFLTDFMLRGNYDDRFQLGLGYRIDLRRDFNVVPGTGFPVPERFAQLLFSIGAAINESTMLSAAYNYTTNTTLFVRDKGNFEITFKLLLHDS